MAFRFRDNAEPEVPTIRPQAPRLTRDEGLTGFVHGLPAGSDDEERFARAFDKTRIWFEYQVPIYTLSTLPGKPKRVDFILKGVQPFEPRGFIGHLFTIGQKTADRLRELELNDSFEKMGMRPLKYALENKDYGGNQESVDAFVRREFWELI